MLNRQRGISLIELLITMAVGLVIIAGTMVFYVNSARVNTENMGAMRLNQELRMAMDVIARDIRRAAYRGLPETTMPGAIECLGVGYSFYVSSCNNFATYTITGTEPAQQIEFNFDRNSNGSVDTSSPDERYGYRLSNGEIQAKVGDAWQPMTDANLVTITQLTFTPTVLPDLMDNHDDVPGSDGTVTVRQIQVSISGTLAGDNTVSRSLTEVARLRNDFYSN